MSFLVPFIAALLGSILASWLLTYLQKRWGLWPSFFAVWVGFLGFLGLIIYLTKP